MNMWFAEPNDEDKWIPSWDTGQGMVFSLSISFDSESECNEFIKTIPAGNNE
jgi:hypothetical protein